VRKDITRFPGVTLIELLIVTSILAILIIATLFYVRSSMPKAHDGQRKADLKKIAVALEQYRSDHGGYPVGFNPNTSDPTRPRGSGCGPNTVLEPYLPEVPCDPQPERPYSYDPRGTDFMGKRGVRVVLGYRLLTHLEYEADPIIAELCPQAPPTQDHCGASALNAGNVTTRTSSEVLELNYGVAANTTLRQ